MNNTKNINNVSLCRFIFHDVSNVKLITETEDIEKGSCAYINSIGAMVVYSNGYWYILSDDIRLVNEKIFVNMSGESTVNICDTKDTMKNGINYLTNDNIIYIKDNSDCMEVKCL